MEGMADMKSTLDCIPCFIRQALSAARMASDDPQVHEQIVREALGWAKDAKLSDPPPVLAQKIHRRLREVVGGQDPYREAKDRFNRLALSLLPGLRRDTLAAPDPIAMAVGLAIAGNVIDMGARHSVTEEDVRHSLATALGGGVVGDCSRFKHSASSAKRILYLADNAGEIVFDRVLIELLSPKRITVAVRGAPVINDATMEDAKAAGLCDMVEVIDNGSDAPCTLLDECSPAFRRRFEEADMIISKGQGNFESLSDVPRNIFFLFQVKCSVIAGRVGLPVGANVLMPQCDVPVL